MWFLFAIASAIIYSLRGVIEKFILKKIDKNILGLSIRLYSIPFFALPFLFDPDLFISPADLSTEFWVLVCYIGLISYPLETVFYFKAMQKEDISLVMPILSIHPVITLGLALVVLNEVPNLLGATGVIVTTFGIYMLKIKHIHQGFFTPIIQLKNNLAVRYMLITATLISIGTVIDKIAISTANVYMYAFVSHVLMSLSLLTIAILKSKQNLHQVFKYYKEYFLIGFIIFAYTTLYLLALRDAFVGYVSAVKSASVLLTIVFGVILFKEKDLLPRIISGIVITAGLIIIKLA